MLLDRFKHPPGGFPYREKAPLQKWTAPDPMLPFELVARQIQALRLANPRAGLDPSWEVVCNDLDAYTCARLHNNPTICESVNNSTPLAPAKKTSGCAGCGSRRRKNT